MAFCNGGIAFHKKLRDGIIIGGACPGRCRSYLKVFRKSIAAWWKRLLKLTVRLRNFHLNS